MKTAEEFIPLTVGNQWIYNYGFDDNPSKQQITVVGSITRDGTEWFQVEYTFQGSSTADTLLLRNDGHRHIAYLRSLKEESVLIDFSKTELDSAKLEMAVVKEQNKVVEIESRTYAGCVVVSSGFMDAGVETYAPGVGLVESWWFRGRKKLVGGIVNGKKIEA